MTKIAYVTSWWLASGEINRRVVIGYSAVYRCILKHEKIKVEDVSHACSTLAASR